MADYRKKGSVPNSTTNSEKLLQTQVDYLHDLTSYAEFIKDYVEKLKDNKGSIDQVKSDIKNPTQSTSATKEDIEFVHATGTLIDVIGKVDISKFGKNIEAVKGVTGLVNQIIEGLKIEKGEDLDNKLKVLDTVSKFSVAIVELGDHILKAAFKLRIARPFVGMITGTINKIVKRMGTKETIEETKNAAEAVNIISESILNLSWKLVLAAPLLILAMPAMVIFKGLITLTQWAFKHIDIKTVNEGSAGMAKMGLSLVAFAGGLTLAAMILGKVAEGGNGAAMGGGLLILFGSLAITLLIFKYLGSDGKKLAEGALGLLVISGALAIFAVSLVFSTALIAAVGLGSLLTLLVVGGFATEFYFIGKNAFEIAMGALVVAAMGLSLYFLAKGIVPLSEAIAAHPISTTIGIPVAIGALALTYTAIGTQAEFIALGASAIGLIGGSLWAIGKGLQTLLSLPLITKELADGWYMGITSIFRAFGAVGMWDMAKTTLAIPAMIAISVALPNLADGISKWKSISGSWTQDDAETLTFTIQSLTKAYATAAGGNPLAQMKVFGFTIMESDVETGIRTTMRMGQNLNLLADGISKWKNLNLTKEDMGLINANLLLVLTTIPNAFADVGKMDKGGEPSPQNASLLKQLTGGDLNRGNVDAGIAASMRMGENLTKLADGVFAWSSKGKMGKIASTEINDISHNIAFVLTAIGGSFNAIGILDKGGKTTSILSLLVGNDFSKGNVDAGIASTKEMSARLTELASGVFEWSSKGKMGRIASSEYKQITDNISNILIALPNSFAIIGAKTGTFMKSDIDKGIDSLARLTPILSSVATAVATFRQMESEGKQSAENIGKDIGQGIQWIFYGINKASVYTKGVNIQQMATGLGAIAGSMQIVGSSSRTAYAELKRLIDLYDPLANFMKLFVDFSKNLRDQQISINAMQLQNLVAYSNLIDKLTSLGKVDANTFKENTGYLLGKKLDVPSGGNNVEHENKAVSPKSGGTSAISAVDKNAKKPIETHEKGITQADSHELLQQIAQALVGIASILQQNTPDAVASAMVDKLGHLTIPILVKDKGKING